MRDGWSNWQFMSKVGGKINSSSVDMQTACDSFAHVAIGLAVHYL
jgi:hypothetical protein